jgi:predicted nucleic acid-binding protein
MLSLIDTTVVIDHLADVPKASQFLAARAKDGVAISIITYMEAYQGVLRSPHPKAAQAKFDTFAKSVLFYPSRLQ